MRPRLQPGSTGAITVESTGPKTYRARARYCDWSGQVRQMERHAGTKQASRDALTAGIKEALDASNVGANATVTDRTTLLELATLWREEIPYLSLADSTARVYRSILTKHVEAQDAPLRGAPIGTITGAKLTAALRQIATRSGAGAAKTLASVYRNLFAFAMQHEALENNPARNMTYSPSQFASRTNAKSKDGVDRTRDHDRAFTDDEREAILAELRSDPYYEQYQLRILMEVMAGTGARIGEACHLAWHHIDFEDNLIRIPGTKNKTSLRVVEAPEWLMATLREKREEWQPGPDDPVCPSPLLKWRDNSNSVRSVNGALERLGYPWATSHTFRRTVASRMDKAGVSLQEIANQLGHAQVSTTMNEYLDRKAVPRLGKHL